MFGNTTPKLGFLGEGLINTRCPKNIFINGGHMPETVLLPIVLAKGVDCIDGDRTNDTNFTLLYRNKYVTLLGVPHS